MRAVTLVIRLRCKTNSNKFVFQIIVELYFVWVTPGFKPLGAAEEDILKNNKFILSYVILSFHCQR